MKPDHPDMLSLRSRLDELDRQIASEGAQAAGGRANTLLAEYRAAAAAESALQGRVSALKGSVLDLRGRSVRYNILQRDVDTNRGLYDALLSRYKEIGVAGGVGASPVSIVDRAVVPSGPFKPNLLYNLIAGLGLGLSPVSLPLWRWSSCTTRSRTGKTCATSLASPVSASSRAGVARARWSKT